MKKIGGKKIDSGRTLITFDPKLKAIAELPQAIAEISAKKWWNKLGYDMQILAVLRKLGMAILEEDVRSIYIFSLAKYAVNKKSADLISFFSRNEIMNIFKTCIQEKEGPSEYKLVSRIQYSQASRKLKQLSLNIDLSEEIKAFKRIFESYQEYTVIPYYMVSQFNRKNKGYIQLLDIILKR